MKGGLYIIKQDGSIEFRTIDKPPTHTELHEIVGGYIELVPYWTELIVPSMKINSRCVAFCDADGKTTGNKELNKRATIMWESVLNRRKGNPMSLRGLDYLVGDIVVVYGDNELMDTL